MISLAKIYKKLLLEDMLPGGLGDNIDLSKVDIEQVKKGLRIELEHTNDPALALEVTLDHLAELPDYYDKLEKMENEE